MQRNQLAAAAFAALLFVGGAAVGALAYRYYVGRTVSASSASPEAARYRYVEEMQDRLKLTRPQLKQLETILHETKAKTRAVRDSYQPQMLKIKQEHIERVKSILTPEQIPAYEKLVAEREQRSREQEEHERISEHQHATATH
jgi:TPP-dependent pyruvate/acetoin dehydrogenase alpha subunit